MIVTAISSARARFVKLLCDWRRQARGRRHDDILQQRIKDRNWQNKQWGDVLPDVLRPREQAQHHTA